MPDVLTPRHSYRPFEYPKFFEMYKRHEQAHWLPSEVPMESDVMDFREKLTDAERSLVVNVLRFFTQGDLEVMGNYNQSLIPFFPKPEIRMMLSSFAAREAVHVMAYAHLNDTLGLDDSEYSTFLDIPSMKAKYDFLSGFRADDLESLAVNCAVFGGAMEGVSLFSSFAMLMNLPRLGKMKGLGQIVTWSAREEQAHCEGVSELFNVLCAENAGLRERVGARVNSNMEKMLALEHSFVDQCFSSGAVDGVSAGDVKDYVSYLARVRLDGLGYGSGQPVPRNPLPWMDVALSGKEHSNFFETRSTEYSKGAVINDW